MQIFYIPDWLMILSYIIGWPILQIIMAYIGNHWPEHFFESDRFPFRTFAFEKNGEIYDKIFRIRKWKPFLPDGAKAHKKGFLKKHLKSLEDEYIEAFIKETCRAEWIHFLEILPFWIFGLWSPGFVVWIMFFYAIMVNVPCMIAQRFNRPRLVRYQIYKKNNRGN